MKVLANGQYTNSVTGQTLLAATAAGTAPPVIKQIRITVTGTMLVNIYQGSDANGSRLVYDSLDKGLSENYPDPIAVTGALLISTTGTGTTYVTLYG